MHFFKSAATVALLTGAYVVSAETGEKGDAPITENNSDRVVYEAVFSSSNIKSARFNFTGTEDGVGVLIHACFTGVNASQPGPYPYHVHDFLVGPNGNCTATGAHLDPYLRGEVTACDADAPETCQVGDLSGKHGKASLEAAKGTWCTSYVDKYLSLNSDDEAFIGNERSIVFHNVNKTRIGCGNIVLAKEQMSGGGSYPSANATATSTGEPPIATGGATRVGASGLALGAILAIGAMLL
ncbi:hypothetical protein TWF569_000061 [Orbilia oligospora]|uniref:Uncharacterized protein n=1 Tax=Orbilia oligospora TaxID=2813651 RepID=A0A7C8P1V5_ORBOL|nr:hypothetical protein TWF102_002091 [Orbilia oligospora]KAF3083775.1 hypothetical protein TWF103_002707 [Orbilia oligospora]KAF3112143.1 hypothetical protein TWF706_010750 [Orbilia oligospora]KAF3128334.1 hypothetical protein TWF594_011665 [Orbilia oligospora]KAF3147376.1 hypothetical protein TWF703_000217 [Orbilia oligospora]